MNHQLLKAITGAAIITLTSGCATITPPPDRIYWDKADSNTQCTDNPSAIHGQYAGSLLSAGLGGADIGVGLAVGYFPVLGIGLAAIGIAGGNDSDVKYEQVKQCKEFKNYVLLRDSSKTAPANSEDKLRNLKDLNEKGLISDKEYMTKRKAIIDSM
jgi:hypothetical protein